MLNDMQEEDVDCATSALQIYHNEENIVTYIKNKLDKKFNPTWDCVVGRNLDIYVTRKTKHVIFFSLGQVAIFLFKSS